MLFKSVPALAVLALAAHVSASEPMPYKPLMKMSIHQMFGVGRRQSDGYKPTESTCSDGATCADACGAGFVTCPSQDSMTHCFNPDIKQICCPDNSGNSCDDGYYCTADTKGETWCCPDSLDLVACAAAYSVTGGLVSETPKTSTTSSASTSSTSSAELITSTSSSVSVTTITSSSSSSFSVKNATITTSSTDTITTCTSTLGSSATYAASNSTTAFVSATPSTTPSSVSISGGSSTGPAALLSILAAAAFAALL